MKTIEYNGPVLFFKIQGEYGKLNDCSQLTVSNRTEYINVFCYYDLFIYLCIKIIEDNKKHSCKSLIV